MYCAYSTTASHHTKRLLDFRSLSFTCIQLISLIKLFTLNVNYLFFLEKLKDSWWIMIIIHLICPCLVVFLHSYLISTYFYENDMSYSLFLCFFVDQKQFGKLLCIIYHCNFTNKVTRKYFNLLLYHINVILFSRAVFSGTLQHGTPHRYGELLNSVNSIITPDMNNSLLQRYAPDEVRNALFQMHPSKSPRPDGMSHFFFQKY